MHQNKDWVSLAAKSWDPYPLQLLKENWKLNANLFKRWDTFFYIITPSKNEFGHLFNTLYFMGGRHISVVSSEPTILRPRFRIPSTPSMLLSFCIKIVIDIEMRKGWKKRPGLAHLKNNIIISVSLSLS